MTCYIELSGKMIVIAIKVKVMIYVYSFLPYFTKSQALS